MQHMKEETYLYKHDIEYSNEEKSNLNNFLKSDKRKFKINK